MSQVLLPQLLTYQQAAEVLQVTDRTVYELVRTGRLKVARFGGSVRIDPRDLDAFIQQAKSGSMHTPANAAPKPE